MEIDRKPFEKAQGKEERKPCRKEGKTENLAKLESLEENLQTRVEHVKNFTRE